MTFSIAAYRSSWSDRGRQACPPVVRDQAANGAEFASWLARIRRWAGGEGDVRISQRTTPVPVIRGRPDRVKTAGGYESAKRQAQMCRARLWEPVPMRGR